MDGCKIMAFGRAAKAVKAEFLTFSPFHLPAKFCSFANLGKIRLWPVLNNLCLPFPGFSLT